MTSLGFTIRARREERGWSLEDLAEEASRIAGAPEISPEAVGYLERARQSFRIDDPREPLPYVLRALGLETGEVVLRALGLAA